jgi:hypothetical protein
MYRRRHNGWTFSYMVGMLVYVFVYVYVYGSTEVVLHMLAHTYTHL